MFSQKLYRRMNSHVTIKFDKEILIMGLVMVCLKKNGTETVPSSIEVYE